MTEKMKSAHSVPGIHPSVGVLAVGGLILLMSTVGSTASLTLTSDLSSPQTAGTPIIWTASYDGPGQFVYRFCHKFSLSAHEYVLRDFSSETSFQWAPITPGPYSVIVHVRRRGDAADTATTSTSFSMVNPAFGGSAAFVMTEHPLVGVYGVAECSDDANQLALEIRRPSDPWQRRSIKPCSSPGFGSSYGVCFQVAGLRPDISYLVRHVELTSSGEIASEPIFFRSGSVTSSSMAGCSPSIPWNGSSRPEEAVLLVSPPPEATTPIPFAVDMAGRLVWYDDGPDQDGEVALITTISEDGSILELLSSEGIHDQILREIDCAGHPLRQTSVGRINVQLAAAGAPDSISSFFHEAIRFPDGTTIVGCAAERMLEGVQGIPAGSPEDVIGNIILALDTDWQLSWYWDAFEHLNLNRAAVLDEHCGNQTPGCPPLNLASIARDWTHGNCLVPAWENGDILYSLRHQDQIAWINYDTGSGDGSVEWLIGKDGDFPIDSGDSDDWFSHQHGIAPRDPVDGSFLIFDNGNTRCQSGDPDCHSRAQRVLISGGEAVVQENTDLGDYSSARGMSQDLSSGNTHFTLGTLGMPSEPLSRSVELDGGQNESFALECTTWAYRSYRIKSMEAPR